MTEQKLNENYGLTEKLRVKCVNIRNEYYDYKGGNSPDFFFLKRK